MAVGILVRTKKRKAIAIIENESRVHVIWLIANFYFHRDELHWYIKALFVDGNGGIFAYFSGDAIQEAFG